MNDSTRRQRRRSLVALHRKRFAAGYAVETLERRTLLTLAGNQLFPADNPWNQNVAAAPVAANSTAIINNIISIKGSNGRLHPDFGQDTGSSDSLYGIPYNVVHGNSTPKVNVVIDDYASESDIQPIPIPANAVLEGDTQDGPTVGLDNRGDSHLIVYDEDNNVAYELYAASRPSENSDGQWHAAQESVWNLNQDTFRPQDETSADAAGLPILPGLVRPDEGLPVSEGGQGVINHAIRFTLTNSAILDQYIYPAEHVANPGNTNAAVEPPMGTRFRLKANVDISKLSPESQIIAQAMKTYGMILADNGSSFFFSGASESVQPDGSILTWNDDDIQSTLTGLKSLDYSDFEVVNLTPIVTNLSTSTGSPGTTVAIVGQNFGGAAGHLQVYFGSTLATQVQIVNDSELIVAAPSGSGTVDVRVQSGTNTGSDSENSKSPIFGYGTSATSTADQFTYASASRTLTLGDPSFEQVSAGQGSSGYLYNPSGSAWTFSTSTGISANNSAFTSGNSAAPDGKQVAFLEYRGSISQAVGNWVAGRYTISFQSAQRGNYGSTQDFEVLVDNTVVGVFTPADTTYRTSTTSVFSVSAGVHTITFQGLDSSGGDSTAFLDAVAIASAPTPTSPSVGDPSFENVPLNGSYAYAPSGSAWSFGVAGTNTGSGITGNNNGFTSGNPNAPDGRQVAFLQSHGVLTQTVSNWVAGSYQISFLAAQRGNYGLREDFEVLVDNTVVGVFTPADTTYRTSTTSVFSVSAGVHTITFQGLDSSGGDSTAFLDAVAIASAPTPTSPSVGDPSFENVPLNGSYAYAPSGSAWSFGVAGTNTGSGITGNNNGFTSGNPNAPDGRQVAFLQSHGVLTQTVSNWVAGSYQISFLAAQRGNYGLREDFEVLVDNTVVGVFTPADTTYRTSTTSVFSVSAGVHTITFQGLDSSGGDSTAFLDAVAIASANTPNARQVSSPPASTSAPVAAAAAEFLSVAVPALGTDPTPPLAIQGAETSNLKVTTVRSVVPRPGLYPRIATW